jgi:hypothetical protein
MVGQLFGCQPSSEGLLDFIIEAKEGAVHTFSGGLSENIIGEGSVIIHPENK